MQTPSEKTYISSFVVLEMLIGQPSEIVKNKAIAMLDHHCRKFIDLSPFMILSTADAKGRTDASPRGDGPGFVKVLNDNKLVIPERKGNKRMDSLKNILDNPHVGLLFFIPGLGETLRVNGKAKLIQDGPLSEELAVQGKNPLILIEVEVEEAFIHCAKAIKRSGLWNQESWAASSSLPSAAQMLADHINLPCVTAGDIEKNLEVSYRERLY
ncbi:MSMEG_1061 family FMN-dependent PPOX-type flavoprotein [Mesobacillus zeae]|uniref:Pyridoxamine 5'-phosphate oxidase family protein n=1 Tax=Mesobacillus zeae TaxID=1917180 RepID=A0A398BE44_9BACI|nr:MSMEG_1061 family FMN-dependent PPOX-type flavoprotein [Mesobacillus zeae]RID85843.1 pyridoxamine 5'-phosphate oxidase family protein [Mesobacillus zeae]